MTFCDMTECYLLTGVRVLSRANTSLAGFRNDLDGTTSMPQSILEMGELKSYKGGLDFGGENANSISGKSDAAGLLQYFEVGGLT